MPCGIWRGEHPWKRNSSFPACSLFQWSIFPESLDAQSLLCHNIVLAVLTRVADCKMCFWPLDSSRAESIPRFRFLYKAWATCIDCWLHIYYWYFWRSWTEIFPMPFGIKLCLFFCINPLTSEICLLASHTICGLFKQFMLIRDSEHGCSLFL